MALRGVRPQPTAIKRLRGNPGQRRLNDAEPLPEVGTWEPPPEIAAVPLALAEWERLAPVLVRARVLTAADRSALTAACLEWARYLDAAGRVAAEGSILHAARTGVPQVNPYLSVARESLKACTRLWPELGLTPSSRSRVKIAEGGGVLPVDNFSEFDDPPPRRAFG